MPEMMLWNVVLIFVIRVIDVSMGTVRLSIIGYSSGFATETL